LHAGQIWPCSSSKTEAPSRANRSSALSLRSTMLQVPGLRHLACMGNTSVSTDRQWHTTSLLPTVNYMMNSESQASGQGSHSPVVDNSVETLSCHWNYSMTPTQSHGEFAQLCWLFKRTRTISTSPSRSTTQVSYGTLTAVQFSRNRVSAGAAPQTCQALSDSEASPTTISSLMM